MFLAPLFSLHHRSGLRVRLSVIAAVISLDLAATTARAQTPDPNMWVTDGYVNAIAVSGNTIYLGGDFTRVGPNTGSFVETDAGTGELLSGWPHVSGPVHCSAPDGVGGWYIGGSFSSVGGVPRANLAHLRADRTLDAWGLGANGPVYALAVSGSTVYVGGNFAVISGQSRSGIAALDASTGLVRPWNPSQAGGSSISAIAVSDSIVYVGGSFSYMGGQIRNNIAALGASAGLATPWNPAMQGSGYVQALAVSGPTVYVGGAFNDIGGQNRDNIAALDAATGLATAWNPAPDLPGLVYALAVSGSTVYVGGHFSNIGGQPRFNLAAVDAVTGLATAWNPDADNDVLTLAASGPTVYVGGNFWNIGGLVRPGMAAIDASTGLATAWNPGISSSGDFNRSVNTLTVEGSSVFAGGAFNSVGGQSRNHIAAIDATTGRPTAWNPGVNGNLVLALAVSGSTVYAGGLFSNIGGQDRSNIAALDAATGLATGWNPGAIDYVFALAVSGSTVYVGGRSIPSIRALDATTGLAVNGLFGANGDVYALTVSGTLLYAGGEFTMIGGQSRSYIAALDATTGLASAWNPGADSTVRALAVSGSTVYAGGDFNSIGGQSRRRIAALDATTGSVAAWNPSAQGYSTATNVSALAANGSMVFAGGYFRNIGGQSRPGIAALDALTGLSTAWNPYVGNGIVVALAVSGSTVYGGGYIPRLGSPGVSGFVAFRPDADAPVVQVLSPNGGGPLAAGGQRFLSWSATDDLAVQSVDLYLSRTGPVGPWELLAAAAPNTGSYLWTVTGPEVTSDNAYLLAAARDYGGHLGTDICNSGFSILNSGVDVAPGDAAIAFALSSAAPTPTTGRSVLTYAIPVRSHVRLALYDVKGREVAVLTDGVLAAGRYTAAVNATDLHSGMYFAHLRAGGRELSRRVVVVK